MIFVGVDNLEVSALIYNVTATPQNRVRFPAQDPLLIPCHLLHYVVSSLISVQSNKAIKNQNITIEKENCLSNQQPFGFNHYIALFLGH